MSDAQTRPTLILRLRDAEDRHSWAEFVEIYTPLLYNYFMNKGLQDADAADLGQEVMQSVAGAISRFEYDRSKGTFRSWLYTIARNRMNNHFRKAGRQPKGSGRTTILQMVENIPDGQPEPEVLWELEHRRRLYEWASEKVRPNFAENSWEAFERIAMKQEDPAKVAEELGMKVGSVYVAKSRITAKLREMIESIDGEWPDLPEIP